MKLYEHPKCSTCKKARVFLEKKGIAPEYVDITKQPPSKEELRRALEVSGSVRKLFNTSGMLYRERGLKEQLETMPDEEAIELLSKEGMLVKRPFFVTSSGVLIGFKQEAWEKQL